MTFLKIASVGFCSGVDTLPDPNDTICVPVYVAVYKQMQADSLQVAKIQIKELGSVIVVQQQRVWLAESKNKEYQGQIAHKDQQLLSLGREKSEVSEKFTKADTRVKELNQDLKRANRTKRVASGVAIAATVVACILGLK